MRNAGRWKGNLKGGELLCEREVEKDVERDKQALAVSQVEERKSVERVHVPSSSLFSGHAVLICSSCPCLSGKHYS